jgi:hypothetical protein
MAVAVAMAVDIDVAVDVPAVLAVIVAVIVAVVLMCGGGVGVTSRSGLKLHAPRGTTSNRAGNAYLVRIPRKQANKV